MFSSQLLIAGMLKAGGVSCSCLGPLTSHRSNGLDKIAVLATSAWDRTLFWRKRNKLCEYNVVSECIRVYRSVNHTQQLFVLFTTLIYDTTNSTKCTYFSTNRSDCCNGVARSCMLTYRGLRVYGSLVNLFYGGETCHGRGVGEGWGSSF